MVEDRLSARPTAHLTCLSRMLKLARPTSRHEVHRKQEHASASLAVGAWGAGACQTRSSDQRRVTCSREAQTRDLQLKPRCSGPRHRKASPGQQQHAGVPLLRSQLNLRRSEALQRSRVLVLPFGLASHPIAALVCQCHMPRHWLGLCVSTALWPQTQFTQATIRVGLTRQPATARWTPQRLSLWSRRRCWS